MPNKSIAKLMLDIIMTAWFLILIDPKNTGFTLHEIAGLTMGALFLFHLILNWSWVKNITKNLFNPKLKASFRWYYVLNVISLISVLTILITGIEISKVLFASGAGGSSHSLVTLHKWVSYFCLGLFGVHIVLHWRFIFDAVQKLAGGLIGPGLRKVVLGAGASVLLLYLLYAQFATGMSNEDSIAPRRNPPSPGHHSQVYEYTTPSGANNNPAVESGSTSITTQNETGSNKTSNLSTSTGNSSEAITLADFLGKMFCTGCEKRCSLLNPGCEKGTRNVQEAKVEYQRLYGTTVTLD